MQRLIILSLPLLLFGCSFYTSSIAEPNLNHIDKKSRQSKTGLAIVLSQLGKMESVSFKNDTQDKLISSKKIWEKEIPKLNFEYLDIIGDDPGLDYMSSYRDLQKRNLVEIEVTAGRVENYSILFFIFSLGILPNIKSHNYTLDAKIYDMNGNKHSLELNKIYEFSEYTSFLIFPLWLFSDSSKYDEILGAVILNYLEELDSRLQHEKLPFPLSAYDSSGQIQKKAVLANVNHFECGNQIYLFRSPRFNKKILAPSVFTSVCSLDIIFLNNLNKQVSLDLSKSRLSVGKEKKSPIQSAIVQDDNQFDGVWTSAKQEINLNSANIITLGVKEKKSQRLFFHILYDEEPIEWELVYEGIKLLIKLSK